MRVTQLEEADFGSPVRSSGARKSRVLVSTPDGDPFTSNFFEQVDQLDEIRFGDFRVLMLDLCRKVRSGLPLSSLFGSTWRELDVWQVQSSSAIMTASTFFLTRQSVGVFGFELDSTDVIVVSLGTPRGKPKPADLAHCRGEAEVYCDCLQRNMIEFLPRS